MCETKENSDPDQTPSRDLSQFSKQTMINIHFPPTMSRHCSPTGGKKI